jgi:hypothetical protein
MVDYKVLRYSKHVPQQRSLLDTWLSFPQFKYLHISLDDAEINPFILLYNNLCNLSWNGELGIELVDNTAMQYSPLLVPVLTKHFDLSKLVCFDYHKKGYNTDRGWLVDLFNIDVGVVHYNVV